MNGGRQDDFVGQIADTHWDLTMETHPFFDYNSVAVRHVINAFSKRWGVPEFKLNPNGKDEEAVEWVKYLQSQRKKNPAHLKDGETPKNEEHNRYRKEKFTEFMRGYYEKE